MNTFPKGIYTHVNTFNIDNLYEEIPDINKFDVLHD